MQPEDYEKLRDVTLSSELSEETLGALTKGAFLQRFPSQTVLFSQGDLPDFLMAAAQSLGFIGPDAAAAIPALKAAAKDEDASVAQAAGDALNLIEVKPEKPPTDK